MKTLSSSGDLATIRNRIALISPTDARLWGLMSAHQMLCHLSDSFEIPLGERPAAPIKASPLPLPIFKWFALRVPMKWPHGVATVPEVKQSIAGTPPANFANDRTTLLTKLDRFVQAAGPWPPHPIFGTLARDEWMRWGYLHVDHHLRQFGR